jgi:beta-glucosidase
LPPFDVPYPEKAAVGYKWYQQKNIRPLFAFGYGLSYTQYDYSSLKADAKSVSFTVSNKGNVDGAEIAQVYAQVPGEAYKRLVGFVKVPLKVGDSKAVTLAIDPTYISVWDASRHAWRQQTGRYVFSVGGASNDTPLTAEVRL